MFQEVESLDGTKYMINLSHVEYASKPPNQEYVKLKMSTYVIKIEITEWNRLKPFVKRL